MVALSASFYLLGHLFWISCWIVVGCGGVVFIYHVDDGKSWRRGATRYRRRARDDGRAQDGGAIWHLGDIDGRPGKVNVMIPLEDGLRKTAVATSVACALACAERLLDWMCFSPAIGRLGKAFGFF